MMRTNPVSSIWVTFGWTHRILRVSARQKGKARTHVCVFGCWLNPQWLSYSALYTDFFRLIAHKQCFPYSTDKVKVMNCHFYTNESYKERYIRIYLSVTTENLNNPQGFGKTWSFFHWMKVLILYPHMLLRIIFLFMIGRRLRFALTSISYLMDLCLNLWIWSCKIQQRPCSVYRSAI